MGVGRWVLVLVWLSRVAGEHGVYRGALVKDVDMLCERYTGGYAPWYMSFDEVTKADATLLRYWEQDHPLLQAVSRSRGGATIQLLSDRIFYAFRGHDLSTKNGWHVDDSGFEWVSPTEEGVGLSLWIPCQSSRELQFSGGIKFTHDACATNRCRERHAFAVPFERGDVLWFDQDTWHRSEDLAVSSPLPRRAAVALRLLVGKPSFRATPFHPWKRVQYCDHNLTEGATVWPRRCFPRLIPPSNDDASVVSYTAMVAAAVRRWTGW